ncbi:MAG: dienelactone hydrolase family protein [Gemmatimonadales bacterium]|nr:dienelactone hydrolase family protein [Gemmatimonadales bacterium]
MARPPILLLAAIVMIAACSREAEQAVTTSIPAAILGEAPAPQGETVTYMPGDPATRGYLAVPQGEGPFPALILVHEWNGLVDRVRQVADAFAEQGYVALAADLYAGRTGASRDENMALVRETRGNMDAVIANLDAAQRFLRERDDVTGKVAVMGWCFGGGIALSYALGGEHHDATAIFYGSLVEDPAELARLDHPVYGTFAEMDQGIPPEQVERFAAALDSIGIENDIHVYDAVNHGFWLRVDGDRELREAPAQDAWERLLAFLGRVLS